MIHGKLLAHFYRDRLRVRLFALLPENKRRRYLQLLRDDCPESEDRLRIRGIIGFHSHCFHLSAGAIANGKCGRDLAFFSGWHLVLLSLCSRATARRVDRFKVNWLLAGVLICEMAHRLFVGGRRMQLDFSLVPFQFAACAKANDDRQGKSKDVCFHLLE